MFKRNPKNKPNQQISMRRTLPVDRYYSSMPARRQIDGDRPRRPTLEGKSLRDIERRPAFTLRELLAIILRWSGMLAILLVIVFNLVLSGVGVKVTPQQSQNLYRQDKDYVSISNSVFESSVFYRSKVTFNSDSFEKSLKQQLPEVEVATAVVPLVGLKLQVGLHIAQPLARVQFNATSQGVIAENGVIVLKGNLADISSKYSDLPLLRLEPNVSLEAGQSLLTSQEVQLLSLLKTEFNGSSVSRPKLESMMYGVEKRELTARFEGVPYFVRCTTAERDAQTQVGAALATLSQLQEQGKAPSEYIDVRVSGRVYVK